MTACLFDVSSWCNYFEWLSQRIFSIGSITSNANSTFLLLIFVDSCSCFRSGRFQKAPCSWLSPSIEIMLGRYGFVEVRYKICVRSVRCPNNRNTDNNATICYILTINTCFGHKWPRSGVQLRYLGLFWCPFCFVISAFLEVIFVFDFWIAVIISYEFILQIPYKLEYLEC
jgi:hypothetical protein